MSKNKNKDSLMFSISDLIDELKSWGLIVAQRAFEWDTVRITNLIDSLLRGFPIGSMLVIESEEPYYKPEKNKKIRVMENIDKGEHKTLLIDGQQRCESIKITFCGEGLYIDGNKKDKSYLWINIASKNKEYREFEEKRGQKYFFHWSVEDEINGLVGKKRKTEGLTPGSPQNGWIRFDKLVRVAEKDENNTIFKIAKLNKNDRFDEKIANEIINATKKALNKKQIPIHFLDNDEIELEDIFNLFIRINTGGLALSQVDAFFTGVKKYWNNAEEHLSCIVNEKTIFERRDAITLLARCAGMSLNEKPFDPVRLRLRHLKHNVSNGEYPLIDRMQELTPQKRKNEFIKSVIWVSEMIESYFHYSYKIMSRYNVMPVVAWAYQYAKKNKELPDKEDMRYIRPIIGYLFWTIVFRSRYYGRTKFDRETFKVAWEYGEEGKIFPYKNSTMQELCFNYQYVQDYIPDNADITSLNEDENSYKICKIMNRSKEYFLSIFQEISHYDIDWDHLIAYNFARNKFKKGKRAISKYMYYINMIGNFAGIDSSANRILQDNPPSYKFGNNNIGNNYNNTKFIITNPLLYEKEKELCIKIEDLLENNNIKGAEESMRNFTLKRAYRIWRKVTNVVGNPPKKIYHNH